MSDDDGVRQVTRFQAACPCGWESEELYEEVSEARWHFEKHEVHSCMLPWKTDLIDGCRCGHARTSHGEVITRCTICECEQFDGRADAQAND